jgi:signal transduction histidine kinase
MDGRSLRVLFIEDSEDDVALLTRELKRGGFAVAGRRVDGAAALADALAEPWDIVLCDYLIPGFGAIEAFAQVRACDRDVPFIIVSGAVGEERAVEALRAGAHDFILKDRLARLVPAITRELAESSTRADLRRAEAMLIHSEKLRALGQMATGIAHDLKNLLNPLGLHLELVDRALRRAGADRAESITAMREIVQRGVETIDRLRAFSRLEPEAIAEQIDLAASARIAIELVRPRLAQSAAVVVRDEVGATGLVHARANEVIGAIVNCLVNAIDACGEAGTITVGGGIDDRHAWIDVADDGPGMSPEVAARIFEPFFSTKGDLGTGLGLANVFATLRRHGGEVLLDTAPGAGARFTLRFPR